MEDSKKKRIGILAASAAASFFATAPVAIAGPKLVDGHYCSPTCKGKSACGGMGNTNGCHGANECAGQGWMKANSKEECKKVGGKWAKFTKKKPKKKAGGSGSEHHMGGSGSQNKMQKKKDEGK